MMPMGWPLWLGWVLTITLGWSVGGYGSMAEGSSSDIIVAGYAGVVVGGIGGWALLGLYTGLLPGLCL
jgi:hypothetical protein